MNAARTPLPCSRSPRPRGRGLARPLSRRRIGLSLLEVMLAIAILGGAMVVLAELVRIGSRCSREARELTLAQLLCEAKLAEVAMGFVPAQAASQQPCETDPNWVFTIDVQPGDQEGLLMVMVRISEAQPIGPRPLEFTLTRWMVDPSLELASPSDSTATSDGTSTTSSSTGGTTGSSGSSTGGSGASGS